MGLFTQVHANHLGEDLDMHKNKIVNYAWSPLLNTYLISIIYQFINGNYYLCKTGTSAIINAFHSSTVTAKD